jgi:hypothetical protein
MGALGYLENSISGGYRPAEIRFKVGQNSLQMLPKNRRSPLYEMKSILESRYNSC